MASGSDPAGNILTEFTMEAVDGDFDITDTPLLDVPELKVGEDYRSLPVKTAFTGYIIIIPAFPMP